MIKIKQYKLSKMCYIADIKNDIERVCGVSEINLKYLRDRLLSGSAYDFVESTNYRAERAGKKQYIYKRVTILTKTNEVYNLVWNFKKEFPVFVVGRLHYYMSKYLDDDFCLHTDEDLPENIALLLSEFTEQYIKDETIKLK